MKNAGESGPLYVCYSLYPQLKLLSAWDTFICLLPITGSLAAVKKLPGEHGAPILYSLNPRRLETFI